MPATRSGSRLKSKGTEPVRLDLSSVPDDDEDVIIISSDDEAIDGTALALKKAQQEVRSLRKKLLAKEASSSQVLSEQRNNRGDDSNSSARFKKSEEEERLRLETDLHQATADIKKMQSALRHEKGQRAAETSQMKHLKKRAKMAENENTSLKIVNQELRDRISRNNDNKALCDLEEHILCEVCTDKFWHPFTLSGCGHTFCQRCLIDWFDTAFQTAVLANAHHAHYTCPTCRAPVHQKPIEDYALKGVVRAIAHAIDPVGGSPPAAPRDRHGRGPWTRFFG